jgi:hypothetical protein
MEQLYLLARGPLCWAAFGLFFAGGLRLLLRTWREAKKKDASSVAYFSPGYALRSIFNWSIPFNALGWRENPAVCLATYGLHLSLLALVLFTDGHTVLWDYAFGLTLRTLPPAVSDTLTMVALACLVVLAGRRILAPQVKFVTTPKDWLALGLVFVPVLTGFLAGSGLGSSLVMTTLHILSAEILIVLIPLTRLSHAVFILFTRAYLGSEFGGVRHCKDW